MLTKPTPKEQRVNNLNKTIKLPRNRYSCRFVEEAFQFSKKGQPMIVLTPEFVSPDSFTNPADGSVVNIAGVELNKKYMVLSSNKGEEASQTVFNMYSDLRDLLNVPIPEEGIDINNPPKSLEGIVFDAICDGEEYAQRMDPTPEQEKKGEMGAIIKDANGKELKYYRPVIVEILGLSAESNQAAAGNRPF